MFVLWYRGEEYIPPYCRHKPRAKRTQYPNAKKKRNDTKTLDSPYSVFKDIDVLHSRFGPSFARNEWTSNYVLGGIHMTKVWRYKGMKLKLKHTYCVIFWWCEVGREALSGVFYHLFQGNFLPNAVLKQLSATEDCKFFLWKMRKDADAQYLNNCVPFNK